ncbi:mitochondrial intermediate peptidase [Lycorma delicatula]|uniref:mitochondrial intermediate peptidase n=1 Tax=Lycorma delicatula TaxID=130591 RepID=UPI003F518C65
MIGQSSQLLCKGHQSVLYSAVLFSFSKHFQVINYNSRSVSTWSPLATTFNSRPGRKLNLNLLKDNVGLFGVHELQTHDGLYLLKKDVTVAADLLLEESCSPKRKRKIVEVFDELSNTLCKVADLAEFLRFAHPDVKFSEAAKETCIAVSGIVEKMNTNKKLYSALKNIVMSGDKMPTTAVDDHVSKLFLVDFELCGIHLEEKKRNYVVALNDYILQLGQEFMAHATAPRIVPKTVLPESIRHMFNINGDQIIVNGLYAELSNETAREAAYKVYLFPDKHQDHLLNEMLESRNKLAQLCGFPTFAHRALNLSLAENPNNVSQFLNLLSKELRPRSEQEIRVMAKMKEEESNFRPVAAWDVPYLTSKRKKYLLNIGGGEFSSYFSLGACMDGLNNLFNKLYGVHFENEPLQPGEGWAPDIYKLAVIDESGDLLGHIYCDFYERTNKPNQDCHFTIRGGKQLSDGSYQNPVVVLMLNLPYPCWSGPSLLSPSQVDNLFHEMGHAMHSMFARTQYQHVTGTRCSTDFAEVPSVLMEFFASDPRVLRSFAKHFITQEPMPEQMLSRLCASKYIFAASEMQLQVFYSVLDQRFHGEFPLKGSTTDILAETQQEHFSIPYVPNTAWQLRFSHLVGYGAKYYSYLMSRAVATWIWHSYFNKDPFSREQGERYRECCLKHGGGKPLHNLVGDFFQHEVSPSNMVSALIQDLDSHNS